MPKPAAKNFQRDRLIISLLSEGESVAVLSVALGLSARRLSGIRRAGAGAAPPASLTPRELRGVRRDLLLHAAAVANPEALAWLAAQRGAGLRSR